MYSSVDPDNEYLPLTSLGGVAEAGAAKVITATRASTIPNRIRLFIGFLLFVCPKLPQKKAPTETPS
jgi:hypothetical protein